MNNIIGFHGSDSKDGCTMVAQSVAQALSKKYKDSDILLLSLCSGRNDQFSKGVANSLSAFIEKLKRGIPIKKSELAYGKLGERIFFLDGFGQDVSKLGLPEGWIEEMLSNLSKQFGIIVLDTGAKSNDAFSLEGLKRAKKSFLITTGSEASVSKLWRDRKCYEKLGVKFDNLVINKLKGSDGYIRERVEETYGNNFDKDYVISETGDWRMAELAHRTFFEMKKIGFSRGIKKIVRDIELEIRDETGKIL